MIIRVNGRSSSAIRLAIYCYAHATPLDDLDVADAIDQRLNDFTGGETPPRDSVDKC